MNRAPEKTKRHGEEGELYRHGQAILAFTVFRYKQPRVAQPGLLFDRGKWVGQNTAVHVRNCSRFRTVFVVV